MATAAAVEAGAEAGQYGPLAFLEGGKAGDPESHAAAQVPPPVRAGFCHSIACTKYILPYSTFIPHLLVTIMESSLSCLIWNFLKVGWCVSLIPLSDQNTMIIYVHEDVIYGHIYNYNL